MVLRERIEFGSSAHSPLILNENIGRSNPIVWDLCVDVKPAPK